MLYLLYLTIQRILHSHPPLQRTQPGGRSGTSQVAKEMGNFDVIPWVKEYQLRLGGYVLRDRRGELDCWFLVSVCSPLRVCQGRERGAESIHFDKKDVDATKKRALWFQS